MKSWLTAARNEARSRWAPDFDETDSTLRSAAQAGTIITVVVIGVIALIGILIFAQIENSLPSIGNDQLNSSSTNITEGFANAMELVPIVLLVLVAALVIMTVQRMRGGGGLR
jgi:cytochrome b561